MGVNAGVGAAKLLLERALDGRVGNPFKVKEVRQKGWKGLTTTEQVKDAIAVLELYGWARMESDQTGGRPSEYCAIHPRASDFYLPRGTTPLNPLKPPADPLEGLEGCVSRGNEKQSADEPRGESESGEPSQRPSRIVF